MTLLDSVPESVRLAFNEREPWLADNVTPDVTPDSLIKIGIAPEDAVMSVTLARWVKMRNIYRYTKELADELNGDMEDIELPVEALDALPARCIYVQTPFDEYLDGFFATKLMREAVSVLYICSIYRDGSQVILPVELVPGRRLSQAAKRMDRSMAAESEVGEPTYLYDALTFYMPLCVYLCADNADLKRLPRPPRPKGVKQSALPALPVVTEVGTEFAVIYRRFIKETAQKDDVTGTRISRKVRPHMRRGHYHHYWTGPKSQPDARRLVLHWIDPLIVGGGGMPVMTVNFVEKPKKKGEKR